MLVRFLQSIVLVFIVGNAYGQDILVSASGQSTYNKKGIQESNSILLTSPITFPNYWSNYSNQPSVTYIRSYSGLPGLVYKHINRIANHYYKKALKETWEQSFLQTPDLIKEKRSYALRALDGHSTWWSKTHFFDYFPAEKGGQTTKYITIGRTYEVLSMGPLTLTNSGRVALNSWKVSVDTDRDPPSNKLTRDIDGVSTQRNSNKHYSLAISPPNKDLYRNNSWSVSGSIKLGVRINTLSNNRSSISGSLKIVGTSWRYKKTNVIIRLKCKARPFTKDYAIEASLIMFMF